MKNLLIYISPTKLPNKPGEDVPSKEAGQLVKVQIENSIQLGWRKQDIVLITNIPWHYGQIKSKVLKDVEFSQISPDVSKINAIVKLFEKNKIKDKEVYWYHDLDAFQLEKITQEELKLGKFDLALTQNDKNNGWSTNSIFFTKGAENIFKKVKDIMDKDKISDALALDLLTKNKTTKKSVKKLNKTYNFTPFNLLSSYKKAKKPLKVAYFHPFGEISKLGVVSALKFYLGDNKLKTPLITRRLYKIFKYHRIG